MFNRWQHGGGRRVLTASMAAALVFGACGSGAASPSAAPSVNPTPAASTGASTAPSTAASESPAASAASGLPEIACDSAITATITVSGWDQGTKALAAGDPEFAKCFPGITVKYDTAIYTAGYQLVLAAGKGAPDVGMVEDSSMAQLTGLNGFVDLTDKVGPYLDKYTPYEWELGKADGRYYGFPGSPAPVAVYYNRSIFEKAGVDPMSIKTWDDYYAAAQTIKAKAGVPMLMLGKASFNTWEGGDFGMLMWSRRLTYVDANNQVTFDKDPRAKEILDFFDKLWADGLAKDVDIYSDAYLKLLGSDAIATEIGGSWITSQLKQGLGDKGSGKFGVFPLPVFTDADAHASNNGGWSMAIFKQSANQQAAWDYVQFHLGRVDEELSRYQGTFSELPAMFAACDDPFMQQPDPYFGGQAVTALFCQASRDIPATTPYTTDYNQIMNILGPYIQKWATGALSAQDMLTQAANDIRAQTGR